MRKIMYGRGSLGVQVLVCSIFIVPLMVGVSLASRGARRSSMANEISRDIASMYAQGVDFSRQENRDIATRVAEGLGADFTAGKGVVILSKIHLVKSADCYPVGAPCGNSGQAVVTQRFVIGNATLRSSSYGNPATVAGTGLVKNWVNDPTTRANNPPTGLKPGDSMFIAETFLTSDDLRAGVYARSEY